MADAAELPLHPPRYWRCTDKTGACGRKWHHTSMGTILVATARIDRAPTDLFSLPAEINAPREEGCCPACGARCEPEAGFVYGDHPAPAFQIKTADNARWSYVE